MQPPTLTEVFRTALMQTGLSAHEAQQYCWHDEPYHIGNPIAGQTTAHERRAIDAVHLHIKLTAAPRKESLGR